MGLSPAPARERLRMYRTRRPVERSDRDRRRQNCRKCAEQCGKRRPQRFCGRCRESGSMTGTGPGVWEFGLLFDQPFEGRQRIPFTLGKRNQAFPCHGGICECVVCSRSCQQFSGKYDENAHVESSTADGLKLNGRLYWQGTPNRVKRDASERNEFDEQTANDHDDAQECNRMFHERELVLVLLWFRALHRLSFAGEHATRHQAVKTHRARG